MGHRIHILGGGTVSHVRNHLALCAPAYGSTARRIEHLIVNQMIADGRGFEVVAGGDLVMTHLTRMADPQNSRLETNEDVAKLLDQLVADPATRVIIMSAALCDFDANVIEPGAGPGVPHEFQHDESGKHRERLKTSDYARFPARLAAYPADKLIGRIRRTRKDIFAVGFKTTTGATPEEQYSAGLHLLKANSLNLVLANDTVTRMNMIVTPEEAHYGDTTQRDDILELLVKMTLSRSQNTFTRSTVVDGPPVAWDDPSIPENLRVVVDHLIARGAYKPFRGATVGHFAVKLNEHEIITSRRKRDFNKLSEEGMVHLTYDGDTQVIARGGKPSVGGQSQRAIFRDHPTLECIVHAHVPLKRNHDDDIPLVEQWPNECGSHQCGEATSRGLRPIPGLSNVKAVMLDQHGPNIVFDRKTPASEVIGFIERNFALEEKTGGLVA